MSAAHRDDIDGLRAVAVLPVLLFHVGVPGFAGGYVGVDIFFVISGYLITQVLLAGAADGRPAITDFYERRIRRIAPALFAMLAFSTAVAVWRLTPYDLGKFSTELSATALFVSNIRFWRETGYFDTMAQFKPLFHTWTLAVEEQFYIAYPLLLAAVLAWRPKALLPILLALCGLSFAYSAAAALLWRQSAYFLPQSRAWELLVGCCLALGAVPALRGRIAEALSLAGIVCIAFAVFGFTADTPFPGVAALLPCGGAAMLLHANAARTTRVGSVLGAPPLKFVGLISYSLYLWHWPLLAFWRIETGGAISPGMSVLIVGLSFAFAVVSWRFIERPFRRPGAFSRKVDTGFRQKTRQTKESRARFRLEEEATCSGGVVGRRTLFVLFGAATLAFFAIGAAGYFSHGWPQRVSAPVARMLQFKRYFSSAEFERSNSKACFEWKTGAAPFDMTRCVTADPRRRNVLLWGDSIAAQYSLALHEALAGSGVHLMQATRAGCLPVPAPTMPPFPDCDAFNAAVVRRLETQKVDAVLLGGDWLWSSPHRAGSLGALDRTIVGLRARGISVFVMGVGPSFQEALPIIIGRAMQRGVAPGTLRPPPDEKAVALDLAMRNHLKARTGVTYIEVLDTACPDAHCPAMMDARTPLTWNTDHLTLAGARYVIGRLMKGPLAAIAAGSPPRH